MGGMHCSHHERLCPIPLSRLSHLLWTLMLHTGSSVGSCQVLFFVSQVRVKESLPVLTAPAITLSRTEALTDFQEGTANLASLTEDRMVRHIPSFPKSDHRENSILLHITIKNPTSMCFQLSSSLLKSIHPKTHPHTHTYTYLPTGSILLPVKVAAASPTQMFYL